MAHGGVWRLWALLILAHFTIARADVPPQLVLTQLDGPAPPGLVCYPALPTSVEMQLPATNGRLSSADAAELLRQTVVDHHLPAGWLRLDLLAVAGLNDCPTCQLPPPDPHRQLSQPGEAPLDPGRFTFFTAAAKALLATPVRPCVVVPWGSQLPETDSLPPNLWIFLAPSTDATADRAAAWRRWHEVTPRVYNLVTDGLVLPAELPRTGELLRRAAAGVPQPAFLTNRASALSRETPGWLTPRLAAVVAGETVPVADAWRTDQAPFAQAVDVFLPVKARLGELPRAETAMVAGVLELAARLAAWDRRRAAGQPDQPERQALRRAVQQSVPVLPLEFSEFVEHAAPLPRLNLGQGLPHATLDGIVAADEWRGAARLELQQDDFGQPSPRPATVWLSRQGDHLRGAIVATDPNPAEVTLNDRLRLWFSPPTATGPVVCLTTTLRGEVLVQRLQFGAPLGEAIRLRGLTNEGAFDGPGWSLEFDVSVSRLGLTGLGPDWRVNLATEHPTPDRTFRTVWSPTGAMLWNPKRFGRWAEESAAAR